MVPLKAASALVGDHLKPGLFYRDKDRIHDSAFRRLALRCELDLLYRVAKADTLGRRAEGAREPSSEAQEWFLERASTLKVTYEPVPPLLMGRHLLEMGLKPGPRVGEITQEVYQLQLDGTVTNEQEAKAAGFDRIQKA